MRRRGEFPDNGFEAWGGYMNAKKAKLEEQFSSRVGKDENQVSNIFSGISIYVNGFTIPSADELKTLMSQHGGVYHTYQRSDDFIIASNLPDTKVKKMSLIKVVKPEWITESIAANKLLNYKEYLLFKNCRTQQTLNFKLAKDDVDLKENSKLVIETNDVTETEQSCDNGKHFIQSQNMPCEDKAALVYETKYPTSINHKQNEFKATNLNIDTKKEQVKTAADPNFISEFYNNSRLHHISQLGACFKQHINDLRETSNFVFPARQNLKERILAMNNFTTLSPLSFERGKTIMHIDMDCFFVSVGLRKRPDLKNKPVAVTHCKGGKGRSKRPGVDRNTEFNLYKQKQIEKITKATGKPKEDIEFESRVDKIADEDDKFGSMSEIASCSYEARAKGISNGMFMGAALRLCPDLQTIPYDFEDYKDVAFTLYNTIAQYTLDIEAVSCDEMYVDCTELLKEINSNAEDFATVLRNEIKEKTGCPCSAGFGGNRLQARLATKKAKPDGQFFLTADLVEDFMYSIKLKELPGVGRQISQKLESLGHQTCGSLQSLTLACLKQHLGNKTGAQLFDQCRGRDLNPLSFYTVRKSVSAEVNYGIRFENNEQCEEFLKQLSTEVHSRMQQFKVLGKCITLKLMVRAAEAPVETAKFMGHGFCDVINKSTTLNNATNNAEIITREIISLFKKLNIAPNEMRGVGIQVTKLEPLNCKQTLGALTKFLHFNKSAKKEKDSQQNLVASESVMKTEVNKKSPTTPKKNKPTSPKQSPIRKRGRPPKHLKLQSNTSKKNILSKFILVQSPTKDTPYKNPMTKDLEATSHFEQPNIQKIEPGSLIGLSWEKVRELLRAWLHSGQAPLYYDVNMITDYMRELVINKDIDKLNILINFLRRKTRELDSKDWTLVYSQVVESIQNAMVAVYGKKLWISD